MDEKTKKHLLVIFQMILLVSLFSSYWKDLGWENSKTKFYSIAIISLILVSFTLFRLILLSKKIENSKFKFFYLTFLIIFVFVVMGFPRFFQISKNEKEDTIAGFMTSVKSAVLSYRGDNFGRWPQNLDSLVPHYLELIPKDPVVGSQKVVAVYDGTGGWVYDQIKGEVSPNFPVTIQGRKY